MRAATDALVRVLLTPALLVVTACGSTAGPPPAGASAAGQRIESGWHPPAVPSGEDLRSALQGESAVTVRVRGRLVVFAAPRERAFDVELLLSRSGAMRLQATGGGRDFLMVSDGARLWTWIGEEEREQAEAWRAPRPDPDRPDASISAFDLVAALLPSAWPDPADTGTPSVTVVEPEGIWVSQLRETPAGRWSVAQRVLLGPSGVMRRESYDDAGALARRIDWAAPGRTVTISRPQAATRVRLEIGALERDPVLAPGSFRPGS